MSRATHVQQQLQPFPLHMMWSDIPPFFVYHYDVVIPMSHIPGYLEMKESTKSLLKERLELLGTIAHTLFANENAAMRKQLAALDEEYKMLWHDWSTQDHIKNMVLYPYYYNET